MADPSKVACAGSAGVSKGPATIGARPTAPLASGALLSPTSSVVDFRDVSLSVRDGFKGPKVHQGGPGL